MSCATFKGVAEPLVLDDRAGVDKGPLVEADVLQARAINAQLDVAVGVREDIDVAMDQLPRGFGRSKPVLTG